MDYLDILIEEYRLTKAEMRDTLSYYTKFLMVVGLAISAIFGIGYAQNVYQIFVITPYLIFFFGAIILHHRSYHRSLTEKLSNLEKDINKKTEKDILIWDSGFNPQFLRFSIIKSRSGKWIIGPKLILVFFALLFFGGISAFSIVAAHKWILQEANEWAIIYLVGTVAICLFLVLAFIFQERNLARIIIEIMAGGNTQHENTSCITHVNMSRVIGLLFAFSIFPFLTLSVGEIFKFIQIGPFRITDYIEILLFGPGMIYLGYKMFTEAYNRTPEHKGFLSVSMIVGAFYIAGVCIHWVANTINVYMTETHNYILLVPSDLYDIIYFIDEVLSHHIMFLSYFSFLTLLAIYPSVQFNVLGKYQKASLLFSGIITGIGTALIYIESQLVISGVVMPALAIAVTYIYTRKKIKNIFSFYLIYLFAAMALTIIIFWFAFHSLSGSILNPKKFYM